MIDPIEQFNIEKLFTIGHIGNHEIAFTNSSAYMFGSVALISLLMIFWGAFATQFERTHTPALSNWRVWILNFTGVALALYGCYP